MTIINKAGWINEDETYIDEMLREEILSGEYEDIDELTDYYKADFIFTEDEAEKYENMIIAYQIEQEETDEDYNYFKMLRESWEEDRAIMEARGIA